MAGTNGAVVDGDNSQAKGPNASCLDSPDALLPGPRLASVGGQSAKLRIHAGCSIVQGQGSQSAPPRWGPPPQIT